MSQTLTPIAGAITIAGRTAGLIGGAILMPTAGAIVVGGAIPFLSPGGSLILRPTAGAISIEGMQAGLMIGLLAGVASGAFLQQTLQSILPAYLYEQYNDDDNVRAFFDAYNAIVQNYVDAFNQINLPVYTETQIQGPLLDWVGNNIYNQPRPVLSTALNISDGPFGEVGFGFGVPLGVFEYDQTTSYLMINDDIYKRIITWNTYRGDGNVFSVRWLKRRVQRFLIGGNGTSPNIDQTYGISVTFSPGNTVNINIGALTVSNVTGDLFGGEEFGIGNGFGVLSATVTSQPVSEFASIFQEAMNNGVLLMPFQNQVVVNLPA